MKTTIKFQKIYTKDIMNGYVYVGKHIYIYKLSMAYNIRVATFVCTWFST